MLQCCDGSQSARARGKDVDPAGLVRGTVRDVDSAFLWELSTPLSYRLVPDGERGDILSVRPEDYARSQVSRSELLIGERNLPAIGM